MSKMAKGEKAFIRGYACATAFVGGKPGLGMPTSAQEMIRESGYTKEDLIEAEVEQSDIDAIYGKESKDE